MKIILLDLEWNQPFPNQRLKKQGNITLLYEVIQIGATLLQEDGQILSTFQAQVKAQQYKKINPFVAKVTKLTTKDLQQGSSLTEAMQAFYHWADLPSAAEDTLLCTWSESDLPILKNNLDFYHIVNELPPQFFDLQAVFACVALGERRSLSVEKALEALAIPIEKPLHQAWTDAAYSAEIYAILAAYAGEKMTEIVADFTYDHRIPRTAKLPLPIKKNRKSLVQTFTSKEYVCPSCGSPLRNIVLQSETVVVKKESRSVAIPQTEAVVQFQEPEQPAQVQQPPPQQNQVKKRKFFTYQLSLFCPEHGKIEAKLSMKHHAEEGYYKGHVHLKRAYPGANSWGCIAPLLPSAIFSSGPLETGEGGAGAGITGEAVVAP